MKRLLRGTRAASDQHWFHRLAEAFVPAAPVLCPEVAAFYDAGVERAWRDERRLAASVDAVFTELDLQFDPGEAH